MLDNWISLPAGFVIATLVSTVGIGGGILWMPFLLLGLKLRPDTAVVTSLLIQTAGMGSGAVAFWRQNQTDLRLSGFLLAVTVPGVAIGAFLTRSITPDHLELILGLLTLATAFIFVSGHESYGHCGREHADLKDVSR
jgi:uncharacterized protein